MGQWGKMGNFRDPGCALQPFDGVAGLTGTRMALPCLNMEEYRGIGPLCQCCVIFWYKVMVIPWDTIQL